MSSGDTLDWLHARAKRRDGEVPELDVERTLDRVRAARDAEPGAVNFWQALSPTEQAAFAGAAREPASPAGAALMREGEQADDVTVILAGWTKVTVNGQDIVQRGPGQLIGEGGAAPGRVRSATVTALEPVRALVMSTADFAAFVGAHPNVPDIVDKQVYDRGTGP
jgi:Cyclic nucleotide-binding domain